MTTTTEQKEACDLIKQHRKYQRMSYKRLNFVTTIDREENHDISIKENIYTNIIGIFCNLRWGWFGIFYRKNKQLKCTNQHAIDELKRMKSFWNHARIFRFMR